LTKIKQVKNVEGIKT